MWRKQASSGKKRQDKSQLKCKLMLRGDHLVGLLCPCMHSNVTAWHITCAKCLCIQNTYKQYVYQNKVMFVLFPWQAQMGIFVCMQWGHLPASLGNLSCRTRLLQTWHSTDAESSSLSWSTTHVQHILFCTQCLLNPIWLFVAEIWPQSSVQHIKS